MKNRLLVCALLLSMIGLGAIGVNSGTANAEEEIGGLYCWQLDICSGQAGCTRGGSVDLCDVSCVGGGTVHCNFLKFDD